jgi:hypothetical protein
LLTCALKNNKGVIPDREKRRFHSLGLTKPIAHLNTKVRNDFILVDGICGDLDFEEGGNPVYAGRLIAARDPVLSDAWAAVHMGHKVSDIPYIGLAEKLGIGSADLSQVKVRELNNCRSAAEEAAMGIISNMASGKVRSLAVYTDGNQACSACYASLIFALSRLGRNEITGLREKVCVGQGFMGKTGILGVGNCCSGFSAFCPGCPPSATDILSFLRKKK